MSANAGDLWRDAELETHFSELTELLKSSEYFWRYHAFKHLQLPWENRHPQLAQCLCELSLDETEKLSESNAALWHFLRNKLPFIDGVEIACALGEFSEAPSFGAEPYDVPGRKWRQICEFSKCIPANDLPLLEWCSGKAHLSRIAVRQRNCTALAIERDTQLIAAGKLLDAREGIAIEFHCLDVLSPNAPHLLRMQQNAIALHACGDLHLRLLALSAEQRVKTITLAPCCYQLIADESRCAISRAALASGLNLQRDDLRTAVHGSVTAPERQRKTRRQLQAWRLGFDLLQRDVRGTDEYLPTPSLPVAVLKQGFEKFCRHVAGNRGIALPDDIDYERYERAGLKRLYAVSALDLPRIAFRRALELWLALDRALYLREKGYRVEVGEFCAHALTPRNILIRAENRIG